MVTHSTEPQSSSKKKHLSISFHLVREAVAVEIIDIFHIDSEDNPSNPLTKSVSGPSLKIIEEMFFFAGVPKEKEATSSKKG